MSENAAKTSFGTVFECFVSFQVVRVSVQGALAADDGFKRVICFANLLFSPFFFGFCPDEIARFFPCV